MNLDIFMIWFLIFSSAVIGGVVVFAIMRALYSKTVGTLRIDTSDPYDGPYLFLELSEDVNNLKSKKYIGLSVSTENLNTPK